MAAETIRLETTKSDAERAAEYKKQLSEALTKVCDVLTAAMRDGIILSFQLQTDALRRSFVAALVATKEL